MQVRSGPLLGLKWSFFGSTFTYGTGAASPTQPTESQGAQNNTNRFFWHFSSFFLVVTSVVLKIEHGSFIQKKLKILTALDLFITVVCLNSDKSKHLMIEVISK